MLEKGEKEKRRKGRMRKAIVFGYNLQEAEEKYKEYCNLNNIPCRFGEAVFLSSKEFSSRNREKIRGYYNEVMKNNVKLVNMSKAGFVSLYKGV